MTVMLTFPESKVEHVVIDGIPFVKIDTGMPIEDLMLALARCIDKGDAAVIEVGEGSE